MAAILCQSALLGRLAAPSARKECVCVCVSLCAQTVQICVPLLAYSLSHSPACAEAAAEAVDKCNGTTMLSRRFCSNSLFERLVGRMLLHLRDCRTPSRLLPLLCGPRERTLQEHSV